MVALQIRQVPDEVRRILAERAASRGQSLQSFLLALITEEAARSANTDILTRFANRQDGSSLSIADLDVAVEQVRAERDRDGS